MCRTVQSFGQTIICLLQMIIRIMMTTLLMIENLIRLVLQTLYNLLSFVFQICSLIPICLVFLMTSKLKFLFCGGAGGCGGGGGCSGNRGGGSCDCVMSFLAVVLIIWLFKTTGVLDKILKKLGYVKEPSKSFLRTKEEFELEKNETEEEDVKERARDDEGKRDVKLEDYDDTTSQPSTIAVATHSGNGTLKSNLTTIYYYLPTITTTETPPAMT
ncbi:hypothetical protein MSG28_007710 [Choristoneura fumiferana]|uniref:Uncharacterized protein n=1 Tax=Choristoneura fumiferana TaxID=7141 RepID=A0ACC0JY66_CHOFU|nr:hypothetical protein MSG28_007710 [Choristoneura fumiferana]